MRILRSSIAIVVIVAGFLLPIQTVEIAQASAPVSTSSITPVVEVAALAAPQMVNLPAMPKVATLSLATQRRYGAMRFALSKKGGWYLWGGNGPSNYDCSGLVVAAYKHVGIYLPRTTGGMFGSSKLIRIPRSQARWGNVVMWGSYHIEMVSSAYRYSFGAHHTGVRIGYRHYWGSPKFYKIRGT